MKNQSSVTTFRREALLLGALGVLGFSGTMPATRLCVRELGPWFVALGRGVGAGILAAGFLLARREPLPERRHWGSLALVAITTVIAFPFFSAWALTRVPASDAAMVLAFVPTLTALVGTLRLGERPAASFWIANAVGVSALLWFLQGTPARLSFAHALLVLASVACAFGYAEGARVARELPGLSVVCWALVLTLPLLAPVLVFGFLPLEHSAPTSAWFGLAYVASVSMFLAFVPWYAALARGGVALTSQLQLLQPLLSVCWAALLLGETTGWRLWLTLFVVIGAIAGSRRSVGATPLRMRARAS